MLTSKERGDRVSNEFLGTQGAERAQLAAMVRQEIDEAIAAERERVEGEAVLANDRAWKAGRP